MNSDEASETPTVAEGLPADPHSPASEETREGVESKVLLARARNKLLGWHEDPVHVGRYRVHERIGTGGMGVVYAAHDDELDRQVAIKILRTDLASGSAGRQRLLREAQAIAKLSHPNVVHVYEVGQEGGQVFMAMELVRGDTLRRWCQSATRSKHEIVEMFLKVGEGLAAAHAEGIVHRDFKPDNVLVGTEGRPRVVDFGLARASGDTTTTREVAVPLAASSSSGHSLRDFDITRTGTVVGTPAYMAPEQLERAEPDARSDQFSFCASLFEALYGQRPFHGSTYTELTHSLSQSRPLAVDPVSAGVPRALHPVILRGLSRDPIERYPTMHELLAALRVGMTQRPQRAWKLALAGSLGLAAATFGIGSLARDHASTPTDETPAVEAKIDEWQSIVAATDLPPTIDTPLPGDPSRLTVHRLHNGLTVYVAHRPLEPFVTAALVVRAGSEQEGEHQQGISELALDAMCAGGERLGVVDPVIERPLLQQQHELLARLPDVEDPEGRAAILRAVDAAQTASASLIAPDELWRASRMLGGRDPMKMSGLGTLFAVAVPRHRLGTWVQLLAEAVQHPSYRLMLQSAQTRLEVAQMMSEWGQLDMLSGRMLREATGQSSDLEQIVATLERVPLAETKAFYETWFRPNNTAIVLVGDITGDQAVPLVEQYFGAWAPAQIPVTEQIDVPLPPARMSYETEGAGPPLVRVSWPLPPASSPEYLGFRALEDTLAGLDGVLAVMLRDTTFGGTAWLGGYRDFNIEVAVLENQSLADTEEMVMGAMRSVAEDRVPDDVWPRVLANAELARHHWARSPGALMQLVADSYLDHRPWSTVAATLSAPPPTRAEVVAAARSLLQRGRVVGYKQPGKPWLLDAPDLPTQRLPSSYGQQSPFLRTLLEAPSTPLEPRFLVAGSHYEVTAHGAGRVITTKSDAPVFRLQWVYPIGVAEDPWVCEAAQSRVVQVPIAGLDVDYYCTNEDTSIDIVAPVARFDEVMPAIVTWLGSTDLPDRQVRDLLDRSLQWRTDSRTDPTARALAMHNFALRGEHSLGMHLPDDAALRRRGPSMIPHAWEAVIGYDPDVLYVGPSPEKLRELLPTPTNRTKGGLPPRTFRTIDRPTVLVLDDPEREKASVRAAIPWTATGARDTLAAQLHAEAALEITMTGPRELDPEFPSYDVRWSPAAPVAIGIGYACGNEDVPFALRTAIDNLRKRLPEGEFAAARDRLEVAFRADRTAPPYVPELVRAWGPDADDPRVAQWLALPSLSYADLQRYYDAVERNEPVLSVVGDLDKLDMAALRELGEVVVVDLEDAMRDPALFEVGWSGPPMMMDE